MMDPKIKRKWVKALRSGNYHQGQMQLCRGGKHCCLGVLVEEMYGEAIWEEDGDGDLTYKGEATNLAASDLAQINLSWNVANYLMKMNDTDCKSFSEIADFIEENL